MNVFHIPSWYPSKDFPQAGIFNKEQAEALANYCKESNFAISTWGSHDNDLLLWMHDHVRNIPKLFKFAGKKAAKSALAPNLTEYYSPAFTWSRKIFSGNIKGIMRVHEKHFLDFQSKVGRVDILHAQSAYPGGWVAMFLGQKYKLPYIITEHMTPFPFKDFLTKQGKISKWLWKPYANAGATVAVSPQQKETLLKHGLPRVTYIPNLCNEEFFKPDSSLSKERKPFRFFTLAGLVPQKGIPYLLHAIRQLRTEDPSLAVSFRIGGDGTHATAYQQLTLELGISESVAWLGSLDRLQALQEFQHCDAFVLPSLHENLPLVLLEAIACGKPVISTYCGGPESIINETNGILVKPGDALSLKDALKEMVEQHHRFSLSRIREDFCKRYSRPVVCKEIMAIYKQVIDEHKLDLKTRVKPLN